MKTKQTFSGSWSLRAAVAGAGLVLAVAFGGPVSAAEKRDQVFALLDSYATIHEALAADDTKGVAEAAAKIAAGARAAAASGPSETKAAYERLAKSADEEKGPDLEAFRRQLGGLSASLAAVVNTTGGREANLFYCSMADAYWLQRTEEPEVRNPYFGSEMPTCGEKVDKIKP